MFTSHFFQVQVKSSSHCPKSKSSLKSFVASPSQVSSHLLQVQFKSQVFWPKSKSSQVPSQLATAQVPSHFEKFCYYLIDAYAILSSLDNLVNIKKKCDYFSTINCIWYHFHDTLFVEYSIWCYIFKCGLICFELIPSTLSCPKASCVEGELSQIHLFTSDHVMLSAW